MKCPKCKTTVNIETTDSLHTCDQCGYEFQIEIDPIDIKVEEKQMADNESAEEPVEPYVSVLPKKFLADDPDFVDPALSGTANNRVLLPDGAGGLTSVVRNVVKIQHRGKTIELLKLTDEERRRWRFWTSAISIVIGVLFIILFFWLLY